MADSYAQTKQDLEEIITKLQGGNLGIDEAAKLHKAGMKKIAELEKLLDQTKNEIKKIDKSH